VVKGKKEWDRLTAEGKIVLSDNELQRLKAGTA
jgi:archaeosine-15-forming tRNA-guanine transglycosylase